MTGGQAPIRALRVVRGRPSEDEVAAVIAILTALAAHRNRRDARSTPRRVKWHRERLGGHEIARSWRTPR